MIEPERRNDMEAADADQVLDEKRLVIRGAILIESDERIVRLRAARRIEKVRAGVRVVERVALERRLAVISDAAERQCAAAEHRAFAPLLPKTQVESAIVELFVAKGRARRENGGIQ